MKPLATHLVPVGLIAALLSAGLVAAQTSPDHPVVSVPALGVAGENLPGVVNYILIQFDRTAGQDGPVVQFNQVSFAGSSRVGEEWMEGARRAVQAVSRTVGDEGRDWLITIKNRSMTHFTDGMSAGAAVAVGIMAAYKGDAIQPDVALSGQITPDGRLDVVGGLPVKIEAAADAHYRTIVVARDQTLTPDWNLANEVAARMQVQLIRVGTLEEAYQVMTGRSR